MKQQGRYMRIFAFGLMLCLTAVLSLSALFITTHADHDCSGDGCQICYEISGCVTAIQHMAEAVGTGTSCLLCACLLLLCLILTQIKESYCTETLVALKVRLDN